MEFESTEILAQVSDMTRRDRDPLCHTLLLSKSNAPKDFYNLENKE